MKTDIRINGEFLIREKMEDGKYSFFLSGINNYEKWIKIENFSKKADVTDKYHKLSNEFGITNNVNFITGQSGGWGYVKVQSGGGWPTLEQNV